MREHDDQDMNQNLSQEARAWRAVIHRVRWATFGLGLLANFVVVFTVVGWHANSIYTRLSNVEDQAEATEAGLTELDVRHEKRMSEIESRQQSADNMAARLEERLIAQARTLARIEDLLQTLARQSHDPRQLPRGFPPKQ